MREFLLFTVHAPLASWGEIAVGELRRSWMAPSRSAVLGVLGAALGIDRSDDEAQRALVQGYRVAIRLDAVGTAMLDYHTVQTVAATHVRKLKPATRAELMAIADRETIISKREYRQNAVVTVVVWTRPGARWSLGDMAQALQYPAFTLFAGRKANPLGLPMQPRVEEARTLVNVLSLRSPVPEKLDPMFRRALLPRNGEWGRTVVHDPCEGFDSGLEGSVRREHRRDVPRDRGIAWLFDQRIVEYGFMPSTGGASS